MTSPSPGSEELAGALQLAVAGDPRGISALSALATKVARSLAAPLVRQDAIDDVSQEAVLEMLATLHQLRNPGAFVAWFRLIVRKQADRHRRQQRPTSQIDAADGLLSSTANPAALAEQDELGHIVRAAIRATPPTDRFVLAHKYFDEWSDQQLADALSISPGAVRKRLFDARRRLRPVLQALLADSTQTAQKEPSMNLDLLFGTVLAPDDVPELNDPIPLTKPESYMPLVTGFPMIDLLAPLPRGGIAEFRPGNILFLSELICNLASAGPAALVAVGARRPSPDGIYSRFHRLVSPEQTAALTISIDCRDGNDEKAVDAGGRLAAALANDGTDVLLVIDEVISASIEEPTLRRHVGLRSGSVTGLRTGRLLNAAVPPLWADANAAIIVSNTNPLENVVLDVDPPTSWSSVLGNAELPSEHAAAAAELRSLFDRAARARKELHHAFDISEGWAGHSSSYVAPEVAAVRVRALIS